MKSRKLCIALMLIGALWLLWTLDYTYNVRSHAFAPPIARVVRAQLTSGPGIHGYSSRTQMRLTYAKFDLAISSVVFMFGLVFLIVLKRLKHTERNDDE